MAKILIINSCSECKGCIQYMDWQDRDHYCKKQNTDTGSYPRITVDVLLAVDPNCPLDNDPKTLDDTIKKDWRITQILLAKATNKTEAEVWDDIQEGTPDYYIDHNEAVEVL